MINQDRWIGSLPKINKESSVGENQLDHDKWVNTISKKKVHNSFKKYTLITILFVLLDRGLFFGSIVFFFNFLFLI